MINNYNSGCDKNAAGNSVVSFVVIIMLMMFSVLPSFGQTVTIGSGTSTGNKYPVSPFYNYSFTEQIILKSEINASGTVTKLRFYSTGLTLTNSNNWTIYLGHTSKSSFASTTDWIQSGAMTQVFSGTVTAPASAGWMEIALTAPFVYNNVDNLVVAVDENAAGLGSSSNFFRITASTFTNRGLYYNSDGTNPDPATVASLTGTQTNYIAQMQLDLSTSPTISVSAFTAFGNQCINTTATNSFTVSAFNLTGNLAIGALSGYTYSTTAGGTYTPTLSLTPSSGNVSQTLYVKFSPTTAAAYPGNIAVSSTGATTQNITPSGTGVDTKPTVSVNGTAGSYTIGGVTISGSTISALGCSSVSAYGIEYSTTSGFATSTFVPTTGFSGSAGGTFNTAITGLNNSTLYYYRAYATNNGGTTVFGTAGTFTTLCGAASLTVTQGFNAATIPSCWSTALANATQTATKISFLTSGTSPATTPNEGTYMVQYNSFSATGGTSGSEERLISVPLNTTGTTSIDVKFDWRNEYNSTNYNSGAYLNEGVQVQYSFDGTTWTNAGSLFARHDATVTAGQAQWKTKTVTIPAAGNKTLVYIAFKFHSEWGDNMFLDNVVIMPSPNCVMPDSPAGVAASTTTANISWSVPPAGAMATGYEYAVTTSATPPAGSGTATTATSVSGIAGLTANTTYYVHVRTNCGSGTYSSWATSSATFTTPKQEPSNYATLFAVGTATTTNIPLTWTAATGTVLPDGYLLKANTSAVADPVDGTDPGAGTLSLATMPSSYKTTGTSATFTTGTAGTMYYFKNYTYTNSSTFINFETDGTVPAVNYATKPLPVTATALAVNTPTTGTVTWSLPSGYSAANHTVLVFVKAASAATAGTPTGNPSGYTANTVFGSGTVYQADSAAYCVYSGDGTTVNITGLTAGTTYYVSAYVVMEAANYDATYSYSAVATTNTAMPAVTPVTWTEGFATTSTPTGWSTGFTFGVPTGITATTNTVYKQFNASNATGEVTTINVGLLGSNDRLAFDYIAANNASPYGPPAASSGSFTVSVSTNYGTSYTTIATINNDGVAGWRRLAYPLSGYAGQYVKVRIAGTRTAGNYNLAFDNFTIEPTPACEQPISPLVASGITIDSATLTWAAPSSAPAMGYEYYYTTTTDNPNTTNPAALGSTAAGTVTVNLTGVLSANTNYKWWIRSVCGTGDYSSWVSGGNFSTLKLEPSNYATTFAVGTVTTTNIPVTWAAATGTTTPDGYVLKANTSATITDPVDGTDPGAGTLSLATMPSSYKATGTSATFTGGTAGTMYYIKNYSYSNSGTNINFKTDGTVPTINYATKPAAVTATSDKTGATTGTITWSLPGAYSAANHSVLVFVKSGSAVTAGTPTNAPTAYTAGAAFGTGTAYQGDASAYCVYKGDGTSVAITGLSANTTYHIMAIVVVDATNYNSTNSYSATSTSNFYTGYCTPAPTSVDGTGITNVVLGTINNATGAETGNYGNYSAMSTTASQSASVAFTITYTTANYAYGTKIWVDWNDDLVFNDTNELVFTGLSPDGVTPSVLSGSFTVPGNAVVGQHRVRIGGTDTDTGPSTSCYASTYGSFEDYTLNVQLPQLPTITSFTPSSYCAATGVITITGTNLSAATLTIGGTAITPLTTNTATNITATVSAGVSGVVKVTTTAGSVETTETFSVTSPPVLTLSASSRSVCAGEASSAVTVTEGLANYATFVWSPSTGVSGTAATGFTFDPTTTTVYTLTASNAGGCSRTWQVTVTVNAKPATVAVTPTSAQLCSGQVQQLTASGGATAGHTVFSENFNSGATGWTKTNNSTGGDPTLAAWDIYLSDTDFHSNDNTNFIMSDSDAQGSGGTTTTLLVSPAFSLTGITSPTLTFYHYYEDTGDNTDNARVQISTDGGGSWTLLGSVITTTQGTETAFVQASYDLSAYAGSANVKIRFRYQAEWGYYWAIDNVLVKGTVAPAYTWTSTQTNTLFTDAAATTAYTGDARATVYAKPSVNATITAVSANVSGCYNSTAVNITVQDKQWTGAIDNLWSTAGNWCGGQVPTQDDNVVIPNTTVKPVITGGISAQANSVSIEMGGKLTVNTGNSLKVQNAVSLASSPSDPALVLQNNANLVQVNNVANIGTGVAEVHRDGSPLLRQDYTFWSSPVAAQKLFQFSPNTLNNRFYTYNTGTDQFNAVPGLGASSNTTFGSGNGYLIRMPNGSFEADGTTLTGTINGTPTQYQAGTHTMVFNGKFTGKTNTGDVVVNTSTAANGYNLLGNPYPSPISIPAFFAANNGNTDGIMYIWRKSNGETVTSAYCTVNANGDYNGNFQPGASDPQGILQTGQGFIVKSTASSLVFNNAMRSTTTANDASFFRMRNNPDVVEKHRIWLNLHRGTAPVAQMLVGYMSNATMGVDTGTDALFINDVATGLNSYLDAKAYAIQGRSLPFSNQDVVPLQFKTNVAGSHTISIDHVDGLFLMDQGIYLKDNVAGITHDLKASPYTFTSETGTFNTRFEVVYTNEALGTDNPVLDANNIIIYKDGGNLHINTGAATMDTVQLFDIRGRLILEKKDLNSASTLISNLKVEEQMLIVKITTTEGAKASKKVIY